MTTPNDKFKIIETAPFIEIGSIGSYNSKSLSQGLEILSQVAQLKHLEF